MNPRPQFDVASQPYRLSPTPWPSGDNVVTYSFATHHIPSDGTRDDTVGGPAPNAQTQRLVREAMDTWEGVRGVQFVEVSDSAAADVRIGIMPSYSPVDPSYESDGPGGTLGVTWTWSVGGVTQEQSIAFDPDDIATPTQIYDIALHELGHVLGIDHSNVPNVVMSGTDGGTDYWHPPGRDELQPDDIAAAVRLWG